MCPTHLKIRHRGYLSDDINNQKGVTKGCVFTTLNIYLDVILTTSMNDNSGILSNYLHNKKLANLDYGDTNNLKDTQSGQNIRQETNENQTEQTEEL